MVYTLDYAPDAGTSVTLLASPSWAAVQPASMSVNVSVTPGQFVTWGATVSLADVSADGVNVSQVALCNVSSTTTPLDTTTAGIQTVLSTSGGSVDIAVDGEYQVPSGAGSPASLSLVICAQGTPAVTGGGTSVSATVNGWVQVVTP
jgi:hypothetical protein